MGVNKILEKIKQYNKIAIYGHIRPDGDCIGSQVGLRDILKATYPNKEVKILGENSEYVKFVGTVDKATDKFCKEALAIVVDTANKQRVSDQRFLQAPEIIKIDHHEPISPYGDLMWVDTKFPACAQMIAYFYARNIKTLKLPKSAAIALYTGMVTDTSRFKYQTVDKLTHQLAALMCDAGAIPSDIDKHLSKVTLNEVELKGEIIKNSVKLPGGFIYYILKDKTMKEFKVSYEDATAMVNELGDIEGYPIWAFIIEDLTRNEIRVRLRSNGPEVDKIANKYNGGGHRFACGCRLSSWNEVDKFAKDCEQKAIQFNKKKK